jgi:hypothetical protein
VENVRRIPVSHYDSAKRINAKLKNLRRGIKLWDNIFPFLKNQIAQVNAVIEMLDNFEELRSFTS